MGIIDKLTGHSSPDTAHGKYSDQSTTTAPSFGQDSTLQSSTQAPIVQERTHDQYNNINNTDTTSIKDRTQVQQTTQPIYDQRTEGVQRDRVDHGTEVHEHGHGGIDRRTEQELSHNREKLAREYHDSHDQSTRTTDGGRSHDTQYRTNKVEEVVPVVQKDVYRPHETEHTKKIVDVHHEQPKLGTHTYAPMSLEDWQRQGNSADTYNQHSTRKNRSGSSSSSSSSDEEGTDKTGTRTTRKKGMGEKIKEKLGMDPKTNDPKDQAYSNTTAHGSGYGNNTTPGTTGYRDNTTTAVPSTTSTGYAEDPTANGEGFSNKTGESGTTNLLTGHHHGGGVGEKVKNAVSGGSTTGTSGYDNNNNSGSGYNQSGTGATTGTTGYGHNYGGERKQGMAGTTGTTGYGDNTTGSGSQYGNTSGSGYNQPAGYGNNDTTGYGNTTGANSKGKEALGLNDRNDQGYSHTGTTGTTGYGNNNNSTGTGYTDSSQYGNTTSSGYNQSAGATTGTTGYGGNNTTDTSYTEPSQYGDNTNSRNQYSDASTTDIHRKKGLGEKVKEKLGM